MVDNGNAVTLTGAAFSGFDLVDTGFTAGTDVLTFNPASTTTRQLAGTYNAANQTFTLGTTANDDDVIVFNDVDNSNTLNGTELAIVVRGVNANGGRWI